MANKVDLKERRLVGKEEGRKFASSKDLQYFECSAVSIVMTTGILVECIIMNPWTVVFMPVPPYTYIIL